MNRRNEHKLRELKYKMHQETKQERLEELRNKLSENEITSVFRYGAICNSVFGKKRILSRKRINQIIISK